MGQKRRRQLNNLLDSLVSSPRNLLIETNHRPKDPVPTFSFKKLVSSDGRLLHHHLEKAFSSSFSFVNRLLLQQKDRITPQALSLSLFQGRFPFLLSLVCPVFSDGYLVRAWICVGGWSAAQADSDPRISRNQRPCGWRESTYTIFIPPADNHPITHGIEKTCARWKISRFGASNCRW